MKPFRREKSGEEGGRFHSKKRFQRDSAPRYGGGDSERFERSSPRFEKRMHAVTCAKCGERCEVPFLPRENKPVYCSNCFRKNENYGPSSAPAMSSRNDFAQINEKLDKIMQALEIQ